jgi:zinc/manganese transport system ATP-binding protein
VTQVVIEAVDVSVALGGRVVLDRVSATVAAGRFVAVLGPNGAGKTTFLRVLLGVIAPVSGVVRVVGRPPGQAHRLIGYAPQRRQLDPDLPLRGAELVALGWDGHRWGPGAFGSKLHPAVWAAIDAVGARDLADAPIGRLSGGEQQRLLLAQALVQGPQILLLDEPLAHLDLHHQRELVALVAHLCRERRLTVLWVGHDVNPLLAVTDEVLYLARGRAAQGPPEEVIQSEVLSRLYGASVEVFRTNGRVFVAALDEQVEHEERRLT